MKTLTENEKQIIDKREAFIAIIMPGFIEDHSKYEACVYAEKKGKLMYAVIQEEIDWDKFKNFDWRKIFYTWLITDDLINSIVSEIKKDISFYTTVKERGDPFTEKR